MTDYDGQDAIITYLNGLTWTSLTKPTFVKFFNQKDSEVANYVIVRLDSITPARLNQDEYVFNHHLSVIFLHSTKANAFANLKYILVNLWQLSDADSNYAIERDIIVNYTTDRQYFTIPVDYTEIIAM